MRSRSLSLGFLLLLGGACSQIIGLGDYEKTDGAATGGTGGGGAASGGRNTGGRLPDAGASGDAGAATGGTGTSTGGAGGVGEAGAAGSDAGGGAGGSSNAGSPGTGGAIASGGASGRGGTTGGGGTAGAGGKGGTGGTLVGGAGGKGGTGGTTGGTGGTSGGTGGKATGGATGGAGGKGGTGGTGTTGGTGGTCSTVDMLLNQNQNFDDFNAVPSKAPEVTPWYDTATDGFAVVNSRAALASASVVPHTGENAAWLGGSGSSYDFTDGFGEFYILDLDLTMPANLTSVTLACYYQAQTSETSATIAASRDFMVAWFWDYAAKDSPYAFHSWLPENTSAGWHAFAYTATGSAAAALSGRSLSLEFYSEVDESLESYFFIDTCTLKVTSCN